MRDATGVALLRPHRITHDSVAPAFGDRRGRYRTRSDATPARYIRALEPASRLSSLIPPRLRKKNCLRIFHSSAWKL